MRKVNTVKFYSRAFTMIELIFVIVIMGILSKFGIEFLAQAYQSFIFSKVNSTLSAQSEAAVESIASRLQFRIKDSVIARQDETHFEAIGGISNDNYKILEWVGSDIDGLRGDVNATWGGIIDLNASSATTLNSPATDLGAADTLIAALSAGGANGASGINNSAIYFIGSDNDINNYGWDKTKADGVDALTDHNTSVMHRINANGNNFNSGIAADFSGTDIYEYYQLAWTAYAVELDANNDLWLYYDYQPWEDEYYTSGSKSLLMENVTTFRFRSVGSVVKIQVCVKSNIIDGSSNDDGEGYSLCKEKTIF